MSDASLTNELNVSQQAAVTSPLGPALVISGAGTGKTRVLTARFVYLAKVCHIPAHRILAITFTNKAAREMRSRIAAVHLDADAKWVNTFHAFCVRFLRAEITLLGYKAEFSIVDDEDLRTIMRSLYRELHIQHDQLAISDAIYHVRKLKETNDDPARYFVALTGRDVLSIPQRDYVKRLLTAYVAYLKRNNQLDFTDMINFTAKIIHEYPDVAERWANKFDAILIDEFQDTDPQQYAIVARLAKTSQNIFAVGDPDQSIYGWRGADSSVSQKLRTDFPDTKRYLLRENYRSTQAILSVANAVIANNKSFDFKELFAASANGPKPRLYHAPDQQSEANWIANRIKEENRLGTPLGAIAVLYRINKQALPLEQALILARIPYFIYGGLRFYQRKEIKDLIAYLRLVLSDDETALARVINSPPRRVGEHTLSALTQYARVQQISLVQALRDVRTIPNIHKAAIPFLKQLHHDIISWRKLRDGSLVSLLDTILKTTKYLGQFHAHEDRDRFEHVKQLKSLLSQREQQHEPGLLSAYLNEIALESEPEQEPPGECVKLMTVHTAKGLEFDCVFIAGLIEGIFPSLRNDGMTLAQKVGEERRIMYVALTRARKKLYLSTFSVDHRWGHTEQSQPSRFIHEINPELLAEDVTAMRPINPREWENDWFDSQQPTNYQDNYYAQPPEFVVGDRIQHKTYGEGVVVEVKPKTIVVAFAVSIGVRELASNHKAIVRKSS